MTKLRNSNNLSPINRGLETSKENARKIIGLWDDVDIGWLVRFKLPFSYAASKNSLYAHSGLPGKSAVYIRQEARNYRDAITLLTKEAIRGRKIKHSKIWIGIFVEKPTHRGDAINVVDLVCDAIKAAIPVDDRWYSIKRLDWSINKADPHLFLEIAQEAGVEDSKACRLCGCIKPLNEFTNYKNGYLGKGSECVVCRAPSYNKGPNKKYRGNP